MLKTLGRFAIACASILYTAVCGAASVASFDEVNSRLTLPTVKVDSGTTYANVVVKLNSFGTLVIDDATVGADIEYQSSGNRILLPSVAVGAARYSKVSLTGATFDIISVGAQLNAAGSGGSPVPVSLASLQGSKDTSFGTFGYRNSTSTAESILKAVHVPARKEVYLFQQHATQGILGRSIVRFNEEGVYDTTYGKSGLFEVADAALELNFSAFTVDSMGRAYFVAWPSGTDGPQGAQVNRLDSTGNPDNSFGTRGSLKLNPSEAAGQTFSQIRVAVTLADDSVLLAGYAATARFGTTRSWVIWKLRSSGQLDTDFGRQGVAAVVSNAADEPSVINVSGNGDIYLSGRRADAAKTWVVTKFNATGVHDAGYGTNGFATVGTGTSLFILDMMVDKAGGLLAVGQTTGTTNKPQGLVTRLLANGAVDGAFGTAGRTLINYYNQPTPVVSDTFADTASRVWLDETGRVLVGGYSLDKSFNGRPTAYSTVTRLLSTGAFDTTFFGGATIALAQAANYGFISRFPGSNIWEGDVRPVFPSADGQHVIGVLLQANTTVHSFVRWK